MSLRTLLCHPSILCSTGDGGCLSRIPSTFVCIRQEHTHFGLSVKEIQERIAFHVLTIWYILAKGVKDKVTLIKEMFYDLKLEEECADIFDKFPCSS